jgi:hypothetical protein
VEKSERQYLNATMLPMIRTLAKANMLPCIVFHMIRDNCVKYAKEMTRQLKACVPLPPILLVVASQAIYHYAHGVRFV